MRHVFFKFLWTSVFLITLHGSGLYNKIIFIKENAFKNVCRMSVFCSDLNVLTFLMLKLEYSNIIRSIPCLVMPWLLELPGHLQTWHWICSRADSRFEPGQWETALHCNNVSHWLGASLESALCRVNITLSSLGKDFNSREPYQHWGMTKKLQCANIFLFPRKQIQRGKG